MTQLTNLAFFRAAPGQTAALGAALSDLVEPTRAEAACLNYDLHQGRDDRDVWFVYENWANENGLAEHMRSPHLQAFLDRASGLLAADIDLRRFTMISAPAAPTSQA